VSEGQVRSGQTIETKAKLEIANIGGKESVEAVLEVRRGERQKRNWP
jgi:hypothetical protein